MVVAEAATGVAEADDSIFPNLTDQDLYMNGDKNENNNTCR